MDQKLTPSQLQTLLGAEETQQLLDLMRKDGGTAWKQAVQAARAGDYQRMQMVLQPLLSGSSAAALAQELHRKLG